MNYTITGAYPRYTITSPHTTITRTHFAAVMDWFTNQLEPGDIICVLTDTPSTLDLETP